MKVSPPKENSNNGRRAPILPLVPEDSEPLNSSNSVSYSLRVSPTDVDSPTYKKYVRVLTGNENVRTVLTWINDSALVKTGLNITSPQNEYVLLKNLLKGSAKTIYTESAETQAKNQKDTDVAAEADPTAKAALRARAIESFLSEDMLREAKKALIQGIVPNKIVAMVKRYLRRECRKPPDMKVRTYYQHLLRINNDELPTLPPFSPAQNMSEDELVDILIYATPKSWMREMDRQGFDPVANSLTSVVNFMERIEQAEESEGMRVDGPTKGNQGNSKSKKKPRSNEGSKYCLYHGNGGHTSNECDVLKKMSTNLKGSKSSGNGGNAKFGNKTWTRKADDSTKSSKKDLAAFIKKKVSQGVKKELNSVDKKRKADDDEFDLAAFDKDLKDFNYTDMDNLKIDSDDDEISC